MKKKVLVCYIEEPTKNHLSDKLMGLGYDVEFIKLGDGKVYGSEPDMMFLDELAQQNMEEAYDAVYNYQKHNTSTKPRKGM